jgi:prepilin-type N-terminal cleavage/methylation domain-containing protein
MIRSSLTTRPARSAFTLVELLVTITIISILASLILGVAAVAGETAREARTKQLITRLHTLLMDHYDSFRNRRVELRQTSIRAPGRGENPGRPLADARLAGMRELLMMELPDRWSDVRGGAIGANANDTPNNVLQTFTAGNFPAQYLTQRPPMSNVYWRRYLSLLSSTYKNTVTGNRNTVGDLWQNQGAECLYMIVTLACGDGEARSQFNQNDIGDTDGDGAFEFIDGWGRPIEFLRWAPGYYSPAQLSPGRMNDIHATAVARGANPDEANQAVVDAIAADHDPFDLFRMVQYNLKNADEGDVFGFRLLPLVCSGGRDEELGMQMAPAFVNTALNPFYDDVDSSANGKQRLGDKLSDAITDNITNHLIEYEKRR